MIEPSPGLSLDTLMATAQIPLSNHAQIMPDTRPCMGKLGPTLPRGNSASGWKCLSERN